MSETKWIGFSRSLWSMLLPIIVLTLNQFGVTTSEAIGDNLSNVFNGGLMVVAAVLQLLHQRDPKATTLKKGGGIASVGIVFIAMGAFVGCATTQSGDRKVDRQKCEEAVEAAQATKVACEYLDTFDQKEKCRLGAEIALSAARLGCTFADDVDGSEQ